jgi:hypothetical protein
VETFVVRLWISASEDLRPELRGLVSHSATGRTAPFIGAEELVGFLRSEPAGPVEGAGAISGLGESGSARIPPEPD